MGPLAGIRVLDISSVLMGPFSTQVLGDYGAEVIAVEPFEGTNSRRMGGGPHRELSGIALNLLRNKQSVAIDLKHPEGRAACLRIAATCDVMITNVRTASLRRLALGYDDVRAVQPDIIYCQAVGFPSGTDREDDAAFDDVIQAATGIADAHRRSSGTPAYAPTVMADKVCALTIVNAVLAALLHRTRGGAGQFIEVPMSDVMTSFMLVEHGASAIAADVSPAHAGYGRVLAPTRRPFRTADGWIAMLPYSSREFDRLFEHGGHPDLVGDERTRGMNHIEHAGMLYGIVAEIVAHQTTAHWLQFCRSNDIAASALASLDEMVAALPIAEHSVAGRYRVIPSPVRFSASAADADRPNDAPCVGQQTTAVLESVGMTVADIEHLHDIGAVASP